MTRMIGGVSKAWLAVGGALLAALLVVAVLGGFNRASDRPADTAVGEWIELTRWDVRVDACRTLVVEDRAPQVEVAMTVVNRWDSTQSSINDSAWQVRMPNGDSFGAGGSTIIFADPERWGAFDPDIQRPAVATMELEQPMWEGDRPILVRFANERSTEGFVFRGAWSADGLAAQVELPCPVMEG